MRLTQIKLAGFKSFVDPVVIPTPSELVGVVGPNGCGKSNIIDAVRWVLGESRASELRGASMQDVIFNGAEGRRPAARASVELVFDNSQGRALGQWSAYTEISVRRVLTRDGNSSYWINQQLVRRRDVHDLFLGTGLGARGYAIIGQGMIHRLIEARPEELRVTLEEAAGVSRYKERRRETENRLADTRENLQRLDDILGELADSLSKLEHQAQVAERYHRLQEERTLKQNLALWLGEQQALEKRRTLAEQLEDVQRRLDADQTQWRSLETRLEGLRQAHHEANEQMHQAQGRLFEAGALVSRHEADIRHLNDTRQKLQVRQSRLQDRLLEWQRQHQVGEQALQAAEAQGLAAKATVAEASEALQAAQEGLPDLEQRLQRLDLERDAARQAVAQCRQELALSEQASRQSLVLMQQAEQRQQRFLAERQAQGSFDHDALEQLTVVCEEAQSGLDVAREQLQGLEAQWAEQLAARDAAYEQAQQARQSLEKIDARCQALMEWQSTVEPDDVTDWLAQRGWADQAALWQQLDVDEGWETALEAVLQHRLQALGPCDLSDTAQWLHDLPHAPLVLFESPPSVSGVASQPPQALSRRVRAADPFLQATLDAWLSGVWTAADLPSAWTNRSQLPVGGFWVVPQGHRVYADSLQLYSADPARDGLLARQQEIIRLQAAAEQARAHCERAEDQLADQQRACRMLEQALRDRQRELAERTQTLHEKRVQHGRLMEEQTHVLAMAKRLQQDLRDVEAQLDTVRAQHDQAQERVAMLREQKAQDEDALARVEAKRGAVAQEVSLKQREVRDRERQVQECEWAVRTAGQRLEEQQRGLRWAHEQQQQSAAELEDLQGELFQLDETQAREALEQALESRVRCEADVKVARQVLEQAAQALREADEARLVLEQGLEPHRARVTALQLDEQAARLAAEQCAAQLAAAQADRHVLAEALQGRDASWHDISWLQAQERRLSAQIESLGAVNLAALDELAALRERQGFLQAQHQDVQAAIQTLEDAIRKIDQETRTQLTQTFERVNGYFGELFPQLFGGGQARLIMTGDEILDAGVQVMAQPPGKRNSSIQLLSGGEKALTATALVFALFRLNPAPFCLLDEVDAPLDDANTQRYVDLVRSMSGRTQFLFISHNKIAMQMARQLIGVTMQEQGVSRIVAVDMEAALQWAMSSA